MFLKIVCIFFFFNYTNADSFADLFAKTLLKRSPSDEVWSGRWFPEKGAKLSLPDVYNQIQENRMLDMNTPDDCDDGKTNITVDYPTSHSDYLCTDNYLVPDRKVYGIIRTATIPKYYVAQHLCMNEKLDYFTSPPLYGPHRKIWARWGEYKYLPEQRWVHNLEHGGVVMLYHPCAQPFLVDVLKTVVTSCLRRHIITPYKDLPLQTPFAIITWGKGLFIPDIDIKEVVNFIRENALHGPEQLNKDGHYDYELIKAADIVSTIDDDIICPYVPKIF